MLSVINPAASASVLPAAGMMTPTDLFSTAAVVTHWPQYWPQPQHQSYGTQQQIVKPQRQQQQQQQQHQQMQLQRQREYVLKSYAASKSVVTPPRPSFAAPAAAASTPPKSRPMMNPNKDYFKPLFVDCSIEYDLPNAPKIPKNSAPILMVDPMGFRYHGGSSSVKQRAICTKRGCSCNAQSSSSSRVSVVSSNINNNNRAVKRSYDHVVLDVNQNSVSVLNRQAAVLDQQQQQQGFQPPTAKRNRASVDQQQQQRQKQQLQQQQSLRQKQQLQEQSLRQKQIHHQQMASYWAQQHQQQHQIVPYSPQMTPGGYWQHPAAAATAQTACDFYHCKELQRHQQEHQRRLMAALRQQQHQQQQAALAAKQRNAAAKQHQMLMASKSMGGSSSSSGGSVCLGCVNGSCQVTWNKENVGIMRSL